VCRIYAQPDVNLVSGPLIISGEDAMAIKDRMFNIRLSQAKYELYMSLSKAEGKSGVGQLFEDAVDERYRDQLRMAAYYQGQTNREKEAVG
jgi:hypothetical protein